jgi:hypothetical protein
MVAVGLIIAGLGLIVSVIFNVLQYRWRKEDKAEQKRKEEWMETERRRKEQSPPDFCNLDGTPGPILVNGKRTSTDGKVDVWGVVTVVNRTPAPMKITPLRLVAAGEEWPYKNISFHLKSNTQQRSDRISLRGNDKEDYDLHFTFPENKRPTHDAELWLASDNRPGEFPIPVRFPK